jgi:hypothetical protein
MRSPRPGAWLPRDRTPLAPLLRRGGYPAPLLRRVAERWQRQCDEERDTVIAATLVTTELARLGAPAGIMGMAARVIEDEIRHVEVCTRVLDALGVTATAPAAETTRSTLGRGESIEARLARALIAGFAVGEPLSAACFAAARSAAREPIIAWAYTELLRDESRHGTFGARAGAWVIRNWSAEQRQALWPDCVAEMESFERRMGGPVSSVPSGKRSQIAEALGLLTPEICCAAMSSSLPRWVLPHLAALGVVPHPTEAPASLQ